MRAHPPSDCASKIEPYAVQKQLCMKECSGSYTLVSKASPGGRLQNSVEGHFFSGSRLKHIFFIFFSKTHFRKTSKNREKNGKFCFSKNIFSKKHFFPVQLSQSECRIRLYSPWTSQNQRGSSRIKRNQTNERVKNDQIHQKIDLGAVLALEAKRRM